MNNNQQTITSKSNANGMKPVYNPTYGYQDEDGKFVPMAEPRSARSALSSSTQHSAQSKKSGLLIPKGTFDPRTFSGGDWFILAILAYGVISGLVDYMGK